MEFLSLAVFLQRVSGASGQANSAFYISTTGNDSNSCDQTAPWRTVHQSYVRVEGFEIRNFRTRVIDISNSAHRALHFRT